MCSRLLAIGYCQYSVFHKLHESIAFCINPIMAGVLQPKHLFLRGGFYAFIPTLGNTRYTRHIIRRIDNEQWYRERICLILQTAMSNLWIDCLGASDHTSDQIDLEKNECSGARNIFSEWNPWSLGGHLAVGVES